MALTVHLNVVVEQLKTIELSERFVQVLQIPYKHTPYLHPFYKPLKNLKRSCLSSPNPISIVHQINSPTAKKLQRIHEGLTQSLTSHQNQHQYHISNRWC